jgi:hypothetical protein
MIFVSSKLETDKGEGCSHTGIGAAPPTPVFEATGKNYCIQSFIQRILSPIPDFESSNPMRI